MGDWSELPPEIIHVISLRIDNPFNLIHFRSVCSCWRSASITKFRPIPSLRCPLPPIYVDDEGEGDCHILRSRVFLIKSLSHDPPWFWLFKLQEDENGEFALRCFCNRTDYSRRCSWPSLSLDLLNSQVIELAQKHVIFYTSKYWDGVFNPIGLMLLGAENKEFMIMWRLYLCGVDIYRSFEERWTKIDTTPGGHIESIASFNGQLYAIGHTGVTEVVKRTLELNSFQRSRPYDNAILERWFVKSENKLLLVEMCIENDNVYYTPTLLAEKGWVEVSELNEERNDWIQVEDLGGRVLFLDYDHCATCLPNHIPGFKPNSIIFPASFGRCQFQVFEFGQQGFNLWEISPSIFRFCHHHHG